jgi:Lipase maturation factor
MLEEIGFLVLFLPATQLLLDVRASALPLSSVAFMLRWFVLRLLFGFGKEKFIGARKSDLLYLRGFFVWMPPPTPLGWLAHHAPAWALRSMLGFMLCAEVIAPVLGLSRGRCGSSPSPLWSC